MSRREPLVVTGGRKELTPARLHTTCLHLGCETLTLVHGSDVGGFGNACGVGWDWDWEGNEERSPRELM